MEKLYIVGFGMGNESLWTHKAKDIIKTAGRVLSTARISESSEKIKRYSLSELMKELENQILGTTAVLVSGDCGFFSVSNSIIQKFSACYDIEMVNGLSSVQYFSAKIGIPYDDAVSISMHGRDGRIVSHVSYNKKIFALTGGDYKAHDICALLYKCGLKEVKLWIGERLSYPDEKITRGTPASLKDTIFNDLAVMYIENNFAVNPHLPISDDAFIRGDIPMTKEEIRWLSLQKLSILPTDIIYDIGAGTGSVSIEMARRAFKGMVYAIETKEEACALIEENRIKHGAFNVEIINNKAPKGFENLPMPDKAFIGGSSGNMDSILQKLIHMNPHIKVTATAITLQSLQQIQDGYAKYGFTRTDIICINTAKSKKVGQYDMMFAQNPVYILTGERDE